MEEDIKCLECCKCSTDYKDGYFKYNDKIYCFDCLTEELENENRLQIVKTTHYYNEDWGDLGTEDDINEVIENILEEYEVEEINE